MEPTKSKAWLKATADEQSGDLGLARMRLTSLAIHCSFDPIVCERVATISLQMHDQHEAGKWFFLCDSSHADAHKCIDLFLNRYNNNAEVIMGELPISFRNLFHNGKASSSTAARFAAMGLKPNPRESVTLGPEKPRPIRDAIVAVLGTVFILYIIVMVILGFAGGNARLIGWIMGKGF